MQNETVKVLNVKVVPNGSLEETMNETAQVMNEAINGFDDAEETVEVEKAKSFLNDFKSYIQSASFKDDVNEVSQKYGVPPKKVAQNFFEKALGTVGDILGIAINVVCSAGHMVVQFAATVVHSIVNLIQGILNGIATIISGNRTCCTSVA